MGWHVETEDIDLCVWGRESCLEACSVCFLPLQRTSTFAHIIWCIWVLSNSFSYHSTANSGTIIGSICAICLDLFYSIRGLLFVKNLGFVMKFAGCWCAADYPFTNAVSRSSEGGRIMRSRTCMQVRCLGRERSLALFLFCYVAIGQPKISKCFMVSSYFEHMHV